MEIKCGYNCSSFCHEENVLFRLLVVGYVYFSYVEFNKHSILQVDHFKKSNATGVPVKAHFIECRGSYIECFPLQIK